MSHSTISLGLGLGGGKAATSSGTPAGGGSFTNEASISLAGPDAFILCGNASSLAPANITLSCWFKASGTIHAFNYIIGKAGATYGSFYLRFTNANKFNYFISFDSGGTHRQATFNTAVTLTDWHHVALTYDGSYIKGYVDGSEDYSIAETRTINYAANATYGTDFWIGKGQFTSNAEGLIDEVALFNSALSASDITAIYNSGVPASLASYSPVSWWRMGDICGSTGTNIPDQGSASNDGTLTNGPTFSTTVPS